MIRVIVITAVLLTAVIVIAVTAVCVYAGEYERIQEQLEEERRRKDEQSKHLDEAKI